MSVSFNLHTSNTYSILELNEKKFYFFPNNVEILEGDFTLDLEGQTVILLGDVTVSNDIKIKASSLFALNALFKAKNGNFSCSVTEKGYFISSGIHAKTADLDGTTHKPYSKEKTLEIKNIFLLAINERNCELLTKNLFNVVKIIKEIDQAPMDENFGIIDSLKFLGVQFV